ncbi:MAG: LysE family translocator [Pseudomonadota bacterium]
MSLDLWFAFAAASAVLLSIPGPTILLVVSYAVGAGRTTALWTVAGVFLGDLVAITLSMLGLGVLLATSAELFTLLKFVGGVYLLWLGWKLLRAPVGGGDGTAELEARSADASGRAMLRHAFIVTALNPKSNMFFIAFLPQFLNPAAPAAAQFALMAATFTGLAAINALIYALAASSLRQRIRRPSVLRWMNRAGGAALISMGALTFFVRRA